MSPSSVDQALKATHSENARLHGMTKINPASLAYIATQVFLQHHCLEIKLTVAAIKHRYSLYYQQHLSSWEQIQKLTQDGFILLEFFEDPEEQEDINQLLLLWNQYTTLFPWWLSQQWLMNFRLVFPAHSSSKALIMKDSALAQLKWKRAEWGWVNPLPTASPPTIIHLSPVILCSLLRCQLYENGFNHFTGFL